MNFSRLQNLSLDPGLLYGQEVFDELIEFGKCRYVHYSHTDDIIRPGQPVPQSEPQTDPAPDLPRTSGPEGRQ